LVRRFADPRSYAFDYAAIHGRIVRPVSGPWIAEAFAGFDRSLNAIEIEQFPRCLSVRTIRTVNFKRAQQRLAAAVAAEHVRLDDILALGKPELEAMPAADCFLDRIERNLATVWPGDVMLHATPTTRQTEALAVERQ
jgi:hypothetical protein